ncbi:MAG: carboxypeptidase-like regulatory domain-containing protein [Bacteroidetes bacterium]|nr:carboxypeptidase-like regulatory domain-containing protein [Bacteroidota bacterium]
MKTLLKNRNLWLISLALVLLFSCKKNEPFDGTFELSGTVFDELTGKPIAYADVRIIERERGWMVGYAGKLVGSQTANKKGEFVISFPAKEEGFSYEIVATENNKYFEDNNPPWVEFTKTGKGRQDITLMPKGYLKLHIKGNKGGWTMSGGGGIWGDIIQVLIQLKLLLILPIRFKKSLML